MIFLAHHIATWLDVPVGLVIAVAIIGRKRGMAALKAHRQAKKSPALLQPER